MIAIINTALTGFEQDIRELLMAFFPGEGFCFTEEEDVRFQLFCEADSLRFLPQKDAEALSGTAADACSNSADDLFCEPIHLNNERAHDKSEVKRALYRLLSRITGIKLPWGTLTGIRPVKLPEQMCTEGKTDAEILERLASFYLISPEKSELILEIAHREESVLRRVDHKAGFSLYIGIPFCPTTCMYCSFTSYPISKWETRVSEYLDCLERELVQLRQIQTGELQGCITGKPLQTVYVGGGTPTALSAEQLDRLLCILEQRMDLSTVCEFTVESGRPDSITAEKLAVLKHHKVERISINPQTMNQHTLDLIGRRHTVEDVRQAFSLARRAGFDNINMDIIMGLPEETEQDVSETLAEICALHPDSLTVHALAVKRAARLNTEGKAWSNLPRAGIEEATRMTELGRKAAKQMGLKPYYLYRQKNMAGNQENTGYAEPGKENLYNILMMEEIHTVIGCGAGASSKVVLENADPAAHGGNLHRVERFENIKNIAEYLPRIDELLEKRAHFFCETCGTPQREKDESNVQ